MKLRIAAATAAALLLSGCGNTNLSDLFSFPGDDDAKPDPSAVAATAPAPGPAPNVFCRNVATRDATADSFDGPTQARMAQKSYAQCVALFGGN